MKTDQTKRDIHISSETKNTSLLAKIGREVLDFALIMLTVMVFGIGILYHQAIIYEVQSTDIYRTYIGSATHDVASAKVTTLTESLPTIIGGGEVSQTREQEQAQIEVALASLGSRTTTPVHTPGLDEYLSQKMLSYEYAFNDLPPGRRIRIPSIDVDAPIVDVEYASDEKLLTADFHEELTR